MKYAMLLSFLGFEVEDRHVPNFWRLMRTSELFGRCWLGVASVIGNCGDLYNGLEMVPMLLLQNPCTKVGLKRFGCRYGSAACIIGRQGSHG